jgi:hypothetical protein
MLFMNRAEKAVYVSFQSDSLRSRMKLGVSPIGSLCPGLRMAFNKTPAAGLFGLGERILRCKLKIYGFN